jgi:hypothetical protein
MPLVSRVVTTDPIGRCREIEGHDREASRITHPLKTWPGLKSVLKNSVAVKKGKKELIMKAGIQEHSS